MKNLILAFVLTLTSFYSGAEAFDEDNYSRIEVITLCGDPLLIVGTTVAEGQEETKWNSAEEVYHGMNLDFYTPVWSDAYKQKQVFSYEIPEETMQTITGLSCPIET